MPIDDELNRGNLDITRSRKPLPLRHKWIVKAFDNLELVLDFWNSEHCRVFAELADIYRAQLNAVRGINPNCIEEFATEKLNPRDIWLGRFDVALNQRYPVARLCESSTSKGAPPAHLEIGEAVRPALCRRSYA